MTRRSRRSLQTVIMTVLFLLGMMSPALATTPPNEPGTEQTSQTTSSENADDAEPADAAENADDADAADDAENVDAADNAENADVAAENADDAPTADAADTAPNAEAAQTGSDAGEAQTRSGDDTTDEAVTVTWSGNGNENLPCTGNTHWILTTGGNDISDATLTVDGKQYSPADTSSEALHFYTGVIDDVQAASATFTGNPDGNYVLTISSCEGEQTTDEGENEPARDGSGEDEAYVANAELKLVPMCKDGDQFVWDVINETGEAVDYQVEVYGHGIVHESTAADGRTSEAFTTEIDGQTILLTEDSDGEWQQAGGSATKQPNRTECVDDGENVEGDEESNESTEVELGDSGTDQSDSCPDSDYFKIEDAESDLLEGTHTYTGTTEDGETWTATLDVTLDDDGEVDSIGIVSSDADAVHYKTGDGVFAAEGTTLDGDKAISWVLFCLDTDEGGNVPPGDGTNDTDDDGEDVENDEQSNESTEVELGGSGTNDVCPDGSDYFKIEDAESDLLEGSHTYTGTTKDGETWTATLDVTLDEDGEVDTITFISGDGYDLAFFKAGQVVDSTSGTLLDADKAISNVTFCLDIANTGDDTEGDDQESDQDIDDTEGDDQESDEDSGDTVTDGDEQGSGPGVIFEEGPSGDGGPLVEDDQPVFTIPENGAGTLVRDSVVPDDADAVRVLDTVLIADAEPEAAPAADVVLTAQVADDAVVSAQVADDELAATGSTSTSLMLLAGLLLLAGAGTLRMQRSLRFE